MRPPASTRGATILVVSLILLQTPDADSRRDGWLISDGDIDFSSERDVAGQVRKSELGELNVGQGDNRTPGYELRP
jgi:hypothetical protein